MRVYTLIPLLIVAVNARPQTPTTTVTSEWKPIENESQNQRLRAENLETRTYKTQINPALKDLVKEPNKIKDTNTTTDFTMDTRTPPKIKIHQKNMEKKKQESTEYSHPGIAEPVDVDSFLETTPKRAIIFRQENKTPTTNSGISTWILLSGQSTTAKPVRKPPAIKATTVITATAQEVDNKTSITEKPTKPTIKVIKPLTTRKPKTTTPTPSTTTSTTITSTVSTAQTTLTDKNNRFVTKIKASMLNNAVKNKTSTTVTAAPPTTISVVTQTTVSTKKPTIKPDVEKTNKTISKNTEVNDLLQLQPEAKDGSIDLINEKSEPTTKRPRRPTTNKRKKNNKNRRRKPTATNKMDTPTNSTKVAIKEKPIGTQIYNYLSREVMPTVGVGLVGLMVTAGLASYFLYPFGALRRTIDVAQDRKDYYYDEYATGGLPEEELIGKVIAGMPEQTAYNSPNSYRTPLARKDYKNEINYNYRNVDSYYPYNKYDMANSDDYQTVSVGTKLGYSRDVVAEHQKETGYTVDDGEQEKKQFVVGNVPKEFEQPVTPVVVPEHGPRSLKIRRKRYVTDEENNEVLDFHYETDKIKPFLQPKFPLKKTDPITISTTTSTTEKSVDRTEIPTTEDSLILQTERPSIFTLLRQLLEIKVRYSINFLVNATDAVSNYLKNVQDRVDTVLKEENSRM